MYLTMNIRCIIDDDTNKWGRYIQGIRVVGGRDKIKESADLFEIDQIILAIPSAPRKEISRILEICKDIERRMGRTGEPQYDEKGERIYKDRPIDIDILLFGDNRIDCPELTIPHKLMYERDFVMIPLKEINDKL
jgi:FlaA1/EpsC-like NDP-sugar epimerase